MKGIIVSKEQMKVWVEDIRKAEERKNSEFRPHQLPSISEQNELRGSIAVMQDADMWD